MIVADLNANGADDAGAHARDTGDMLDEVGRGGLAVGPRDADELKTLGGVVVEVRRRMRHRLATVRDDHLGNVGRISEVDLALDDEDLRSAIDRILSKGMTIGGKTDDAEEHVPGRDPIASIREALHGLIGISEDGALKSLKQLSACLAHDTGPYSGTILY